jgi:ABC-type multidrug transport system fused ATPase/permease subunit
MNYIFVHNSNKQCQCRCIIDYRTKVKITKRTNNDLQNNTEKTKDRATRTHQIPGAGVNSGAPEGWAVPVPYKIFDKHIFGFVLNKVSFFLSLVRILYNQCVLSFLFINLYSFVLFTVLLYLSLLRSATSSLWLYVILMK